MQASPDPGPIPERAAVADRPLLSSLHLSTLLGRGRHGSVFLGRLGGEHVAVKVPLDVDGHTGRDRPSKEGEALGRFRHTHIVSLLAEPLENGALILEHCSGGTLADLLADRGSLDPAEVADIARPIIDALEYIHQLGWIHGDIAPSNLAFRQDGSPVLIDFATARPADSADIAEGNPAFVGPLRKANTILDVRAMAAMTLSALGEPNRWDHGFERSVATREVLATIIERADSGGDVSLDDLRTAFASDLLPLDPAPARDIRQRQAVPVPPGPDFASATQSFGPRPGSRDENGTPTRTVDRRLVLLASVLAMLILGFEIENRTSVTHNEPASSAATINSAVIAADETIRSFEAEWDSASGVLTRAVNGEAQRWVVGEPGDRAAIADWSCNGIESLGIYRPGTGSWFTFSSWETDALSAPPRQLEPGVTIVVQRAPNGCARPIVVGNDR